MKMTTALTLIGTVCLVGCAPQWVQLSPGGYKVQVVDQERVASCRRLGETTAQTQDRVVGVGRSADAVIQEIEYLGRNTGAEMGGDTITPLGPVRDGMQRYGVYRCRP